MKGEERISRQFDHALFEHNVVGGRTIEDLLEVDDVWVANLGHDGQFLGHIGHFGGLLVGHLNSVKFAVLSACGGMDYRKCTTSGKKAPEKSNRGQVRGCTRATGGV